MPAKGYCAPKAAPPLSIEEKIKLLDESDKQYLHGYIDRALREIGTPKERKLKLGEGSAK
ncbi:MAG: hypothetical protein LBS91_09160 [Clostridiales Family XIII bacterium]|jgi:hypothetical protein|nr:hypothetical protein [Clostridiales Family XIII bacterium]